MTGYHQVKLFVKPSSKYPLEKVNDYFIKYLNSLQLDTDDFIIGDLYNARDRELWALFSDKMKISHNMNINEILILGRNISYSSKDNLNLEDYEKQTITFNNYLQRLVSEKLDNILNYVYERYKNEVLQSWQITVMYNSIMRDIKKELEERSLYQNAIRQSVFDCVKQLTSTSSFWREIFPSNYFSHEV